MYKQVSKKFVVEFMPLCMVNISWLIDRIYTVGDIIFTDTDCLVIYRDAFTILFFMTVYMFCSILLKHKIVV